MQEQIPQEMPPEQMEDAGRGTDTVMGHLSLGELVIPRVMLDDPEFMEVMQQAFAQAGADINEFTVGHEANKINPETGHPEFFFKKLKKLFRRASDFILPQLGAVGGAANGLIQGQGLDGALKGGLQGGLNAIASIAGQTFLPMAGSYIGNALGDTFGTAAGSTLSNGAQGATRGTGLTGLVTRASSSLPSLTGLTSAAGGGGGSTFGGSNMFSGQGISSILGGLAQGDAIKKAQEAQLRAQRQQMANIDTFDPSNITEDAGYQFNLEQGQQGLNRSLAAAGGLQSGAALKAASQYNQQYADNALNSAYQRYMNRVGAQNNIYGNTGDIKAGARMAGAENIAKTASGIFNPQPSIEDLLRLYGRA